MTQARNGDYVLAGRLFEQNSPNSSAFAYSSAFTDFFQAITRLADGNFVATGSLFYSDLAGDVVTGLFLEKGTNIKFTWVLKFDSNGTLEWDRKYAGGIAFAR